MRMKNMRMKNSKQKKELGMIKENKFYVAADGCGMCELVIKGKDVLNICRCGDNGPAVDEVYEYEYVKYQLRRFDPARVERVVRDYNPDFFSNPYTDEEIRKELLWVLAWNLFDDDESPVPQTKKWLRHVLDEKLVRMLEK